MPHSLVLIERLDQIAAAHGFQRVVLSGEDNEPAAVLARGLARLASEDASLLDAGAAERAICHRLALYIEAELSSDARERYVVDAEYNRVGPTTPAARGRSTAVKDVLVRGVRKVGGRWVPEDAPRRHSVSPDIIVHRRDLAENALVVEAKVFRVGWDEELIAYDFRKLVSYQEAGQDLEYRAAIFLAILPGTLGAPGGSSFAVYARGDA